MSGLKSSGGVQRRRTGFGVLPGTFLLVTLGFRLGAALATGAGSTFGIPCTHCDRGRSHRSQ
jgi:hypothetical protein